VGENLAELIARHPADERALATERRNARTGVCNRSSGLFRSRAHRIVNAVCLPRIDQLHESLFHSLVGQKGLVTASDDIDNGIANADHVEA